jgi:alpha-tubulin suppressor-like RCC1 family protein
MTTRRASNRNVIRAKGLCPARGRRLALAVCLASVLPVVAFGQGEIVGWGESDHPSFADRHGLVAIKADRHRVLGLGRDGSLVSWGPSTAMEGRPPLPGERFVDIAVGPACQLALRDDGVISAWGTNFRGACDVPAPNEGFRAVAAGGGGCLGLRADGSIAAWGGPRSGVHDLPQPNAGFVALEVGDLFAVALRGDGTLVLWGDAVEWAPPPPAGAGFVALSAGREHFMALHQDGSIAVWGEAWGGTGVSLEPPLPNADFTAIASGDRHCLALKRDGSIHAWGWNLDLDGMDRAGQTDGPSTTNAGFVVIGGAGECSYGVRADGELVAWGLGPEPAHPNAGFVTLGDGGAVRDDGTAVVWHDIWGVDGGIPRLHTGIAQLSGAATHTLALLDDGHVSVWGSCENMRCFPEYDGGLATAIAADTDYSLVVDEDGTVGAAGLNDDGQLDVPWPNIGFRTLSAAGNHVVGLKADGTVVAWGRGGSGQCDVPPLPFPCIAVAAGDTHSLALTRDGVVVAWGANGAGQCDVPEPNRAFIAIAAGTGHSLGLRRDGSIVAWGANGAGQCDVPASGGYSAVTAEGDQSWAIRGMLAIPDVAALPGATHLAVAVPNPFNPRTTLRFDLAADSDVKLRIYDLRGRLVRHLAEGWWPAGPHETAWDGRNDEGVPVASGAYIGSLEVGTSRQDVRLMLVR